MTATRTGVAGSDLRLRSGPRTLTGLDVFAGIGGFRIGATAARGLNVSWAGFCEIDRYATQTYRAMHGQSHEFQLGNLRSITRLPDEHDLNTLPRRRARLHQIRDRLPPFSLLLAGFPCQPYSLMGNRQGRHDDRGSLFYDLAEVIRAVEPEHFVLENVRAIKSVNEGELYRDIIKTLEHDL